MLGTAPVRVRPAAAPARSSDKAWPHGVALSGDASWPAVTVSDYAFDAGAKTVKVYLSLGAALRGPLTDGAVAAEFDADAVPRPRRDFPSLDETKPVWVDACGVGPRASPPSVRRRRNERERASPRRCD